ncbi:MAG: 2-C-methyl-D-erythritol 4-phosphate cytidylyltransferase [Acidimicrobiales bacterium]|jgi:2-C-methyl-D-erythritol 4-phosphate cytidylyltransferase
MATMSPRPGSVWCIVVAAGSGSRFGAAKQFEPLGGERVVDRSTGAAAAVCDGVVVVVPDTGVSTPTSADVRVVGGSTRSESVRRGLEQVPASVDIVLVHDAARPLASPDLFRRVITSIAAGADAAVPVVPVTDTIRDVSGGVVDRGRLRAVQTPQGFRASVLRRAHATRGDATDDAGLVEAAGGVVELVEGERTNLKLTTRDDLVIAESLLSLVRTEESAS